MQRLHEKHLTYAANHRCRCGAGLAYVDHPDSTMWKCSALLLGLEDRRVDHTPPRPFVFWDIPDEHDEITTRPRLYWDHFLEDGQYAREAKLTIGFILVFVLIIVFFLLE